MPFDPSHAPDMERLKKALQYSRGQFVPYLNRAKEAWELYVGPYGTDATLDTPRPRYWNLLAHAVDIFADRLVAQPPRVSIRPDPWSGVSRRLLPAAMKHEGVVNTALKKLRVETANRMAVMNALFGIGATKVGLREEGVTELLGEQIQLTGPYVQSVLMEDLVIDMMARDADQRGYIGNRYQMYLDEAREFSAFHARARSALQEASQAAASLASEAERLNTLGVQPSEEGSYLPLVELWDVFLPREQLLLTLSHDFDLLLRVIEWTGPEQGPIHTLEFRPVPGNALARGVGLDWCLSDQLFNKNFRKLARQANRLKHVALVDQGEESDGERIRKANDGDMIAASRPDVAKEMRFGGPDAGLAGFNDKLGALFSKYAGNLDVLGGLSVASGTATQDSILNANASRLMESLGQPVLKHAKGICTDVARYLWDDPVRTYPAEINIPGYGLRQVELTPEERTAEFFDLMLDVEPYSMGSQTPAAQLTALNGLLTLITPLLPTLQQQGLALDFQELLRIQSRLNGQPEWLRLFSQQGQPLDAETARPAEAPSRPPLGKYERISRSASSETAGETEALKAMSQAET